MPGPAGSGRFCREREKGVFIQSSKLGGVLMVFVVLIVLVVWERGGGIGRTGYIGHIGRVGQAERLGGGGREEFGRKVAGRLKGMPEDG